MQKGKWIMSELINRQMVIDALKKISFSYWFECGEYISEDTREMKIISSNKALEVIEMLPSAQPEPHWIPCGERLPEEKQSVLVTDGSVIWVCDIINTDEGYKWEDSHGYWLDLDEWIAWMSLPKFYNGGGDAE